MAKYVKNAAGQIHAVRDDHPILRHPDVKIVSKPKASKTKASTKSADKDEPTDEPKGDADTAKG